MIYPSLKATVRRGHVELLSDVALPENAVLLVTVLDDTAAASLTLGEHLVAGLQDILLGHVTEMRTPEELERHLDSVFAES